MREKSKKEIDILNHIREQQKNGNSEGINYWKKQLQDYKRYNNIKDYKNDN